MKRLCVITARGGSKRIPRKNIKDFYGKPIMTYSIAAGLKSGLFDEVMVSTEDEEIARIAVEYGASVPFMRSAATSNDYAGTQDVMNEVIREYKKLGKTYDTVCCIYPCAPFVTAEKLIKCCEQFENSDAVHSACVTRFSSPPQGAYKIVDGSLVHNTPELCNLARTQDYEPLYHDVGAFYFYKMDGDRFMHLLYPDRKIMPFIFPDTETQDIDNITDWEIAELKYKLMISKNDEGQTE